MHYNTINKEIKVIFYNDISKNLIAINKLYMYDKYR